VTHRAEADQVVTAPLERGLHLPATHASRTVVDLIRYRSTVGDLTAALALRRLLDRGGSVSDLRTLASHLRAQTGFDAVARLALRLPAPPPVLDSRPLAFPPGYPRPCPPLFPALNRRTG
jgi:hypothetical protein